MDNTQNQPGNDTASQTAPQEETKKTEEASTESASPAAETPAA